MAKEKRQAEILYTYDRLWEQKLTQVYHLLIPDHSSNGISNNLFAEPIEQTTHENSSHLHQSVFEPTKGK